MELRFDNPKVHFQQVHNLDEMRSFLGKNQRIPGTKAGALGRDHVSLSGTSTQAFLEVSDGHSYLNQMPQFATAWKQGMAADPTAIKLYNGDGIVGTPYYPEGNFGAADMQAIERLQPDSFVIGNHDVDNGIDHLAQILQGTTFPVTIANWTIDPSAPLMKLKMPDGSPRVKPYQVVNRGGQTTVIVGLSVNPAEYGLQDARVTYEDPAATLTRLLPQIKKQYPGALVVAQTHIGNTVDGALAKNPAFSDIIFFAAHDHIPMSKPVVDTSAKGDSGVTDSGAYYQNLGVYKVSRDSRGEITDLQGTLMPTANLAKDPATVAAQAPLEAAVTRDYRQTIAQNAAPLTRNKIPGTVDTSLGNYFTDMMMKAGNAYLAAKGEPPADMALFNLTGLRTDLAAGPVTKENLYDILPFDDNMAIAHLTGAQVQQALANSAGRHGDPVAGVTDTIHGTTPSNIMINGAPLDPNKTYTVVTSGYLLDKGGSGYTMLAQGTNPEDTTISLRDSLINAVSTAGTLPAQSNGAPRQSLQ